MLALCVWPFTSVVCKVIESGVTVPVIGVMSVHWPALVVMLLPLFIAGATVVA